jgi:glycosyltransferase involved in cell wall biosynthesis
MKSLCFISSIPAAMNSFMRESICSSAEKWSVSTISNPDDAALLNNLNARFIPLLFARKPKPWRDFLCLVQLIILFQNERFDLVHSITPKVGFLSMLAAWLIGTPNRIHTFTGQVWVNKVRWKRSALKIFDKLIVLFSTHILVDSPSQLDFLISEGVLSKGKGIVIGRGSICGVDTNRFCPDANIRDEVRSELSISAEQLVILFLGRINRDKGILDLAVAFTDIASKRSNVLLVLVGAEEDVLFEQIQQICGLAIVERVHRVSFTNNPERYMAAADVFCLPSYREGFGQVIIEAGASGVPSVASRIYGITDAVEDGKTGVLFTAGDVSGLTQSLLKLIDGPFLRQEMGDAARARALELFPSHKITEEMLKFYTDLLAESGMATKCSRLKKS